MAGNDARADVNVNDPRLMGDSIEARLNRETGRVSWEEMRPFFARGVLVNVDASLDLVAVAVAFARDRQDKVGEWMNAALIERVNDSHARRWEDRQPDMWAVVVAPWVLVQEIAA